MTETIRLATRVAEVLECSRKEAIQYIESGNVEVNGVVVEEPGCRIAPDAPVALKAGARPVPVEPVTILAHKPAGMAAADVAGLFELAQQSPDDKSGIQLLKRHKAGLEMLDPLETQASGLVVLSQDWRIRRKLVDDLYRVEQEYVVEVKGDLVADGLALLNRGTTFNGKQITQIKASWQSENRLRFALKSVSAARAIAHLCQQVGLEVVAIKRLRLGRLPLAGIAPGQWRYLTAFEQF
ncbi:MAG: rsuA [Paucimonas sp.]|nr:rsuA [Paucimonas sp.]